MLLPPVHQRYASHADFIKDITKEDWKIEEIYARFTEFEQQRSMDTKLQKMIYNSPSNISSNAARGGRGGRGGQASNNSNSTSGSNLSDEDKGQIYCTYHKKMGNHFPSECKLKTSDNNTLEIPATRHLNEVVVEVVVEAVAVAVARVVAINLMLPPLTLHLTSPQTLRLRHSPTTMITSLPTSQSRLAKRQPKIMVIQISLHGGCSNLAVHTI
jgi:hypothetical protein